MEVAQISPDKRWIVTGSEDKTARLWDLSANGSTIFPVSRIIRLFPIYRVQKIEAFSEPQRT